MPVFNVQSHPFATPLAALAERDMQIRRAGAGLGWVMNDVSPGRIQAVLNIRTHQAVADITFSQTAFSITYRTSSNLDYDGHTIHPNYNGWIENLEKAIIIQSGF